MHVMQYEITLPADYDMRIIERRVASRGHLLDDLPGLGLKAYCIRTRGRHETAVNQYAPFYVWREQESLARFLAGENFKGLCTSFGRPPVRHWVGLAYERGPAHAVRPTGATRRLERLDPDADASALICSARAEAWSDAAAPGLHSITLALDPDRWEFAYFGLWSQRLPAAAGIPYDVYHLSAPAI